MLFSTTKSSLYATKNPVKKSGYDVPVSGIDNGQFFQIHVPALICIYLSLISVIIVVILSFKRKENKFFFSWPKSDRFVIYMAICDGLFNISHSMDHLHVIITRDHVRPKALCEFYGFMLVVFISAQMVFASCVAINGFVLIYYRKKMYFGTYDYRLLLLVFGVPVLMGLSLISLKMLGPNTVFCFFDAVKGKVANMVLTTLACLLVLVLNIVLYSLTWYRIRKEEPHFKDINGEDAPIIRASHRAARNMSLFVLAFIIQWWAFAAYGVWIITTNNIPIGLIHVTTTFSNIGGILNGIVYFTIRRRNRAAHGTESRTNVTR